MEPVKASSVVATRSSGLRQVGLTVLLLVGGSAVGLVIGEILLRLLIAPAAGYRALTPGLEAKFESQSPSGARSTTVFRVNSMGVRGREWSSDRRSEYRVLCMGGSTTECQTTDQSVVWTTLLEEELGTVAGRSVWVGNIGRSGLASDEHVLQMRHLLDVYDPDVVVLLEGVNDLSRRLRQGPSFDPSIFDSPEGRRRLEEHAFAVSPESPGRGWAKDNWLKRTRTWRLLRRLKFDVLKREEDPGDLGKVGSWRERRAGGRRASELPDLETGLQRYARNLTEIANLARARGVSLLLVTQPVLWRPDLSEREERLLWMGGVGNFRTVPGSLYYEPAALAGGMDAYNATLMRVCRETGAACLDLAALVPKTTEYFFDDCHFTDEAQPLVADSVANALRGMKLKPRRP